jgi:membrane-bound lytic murein transglycosylase B
MNLPSLRSTKEKFTRTFNIIKYKWQYLEYRLFYFARQNTHKISSINIAGRTLFVFAALAVIPMGGINYPQKTAKIEATFDKNSPNVLVTKNKNTQIEIGVSNYDAARGKVMPKKNQVASSSENSDPFQYRPVYQQAAQKYNVPWQLIEAVHQVESGKSGSTSKSSGAGATGPMQFMPGTWRAYQDDGNGDGVTDVTNVYDAIYGAAHLLARSGADEGRIDDALYNYNHSQSYVNKVKNIAYEIGM